MADQIPERESHINLLTDELLYIAEKMEDLILYHRLPFKRFETLRTLERQAYLFQQGTTKTMQSKHLPGIDNKSRAVDYVLYIDNKWTWDSKYRFYYNFFGALVLNNFPKKIRWGGSFKSFYDGPHFELIDE